ncbi:MAG: hypothetical protein KDK64_05770 [Chlamydiia bacterium]|nr:hypothetical protein [Chlamydiia bacterium]
MTEYQAVSFKRVGAQLAGLSLVYMALRYQKVEGMRNATTLFALSALGQGLTPRMGTPLGYPTHWNVVLDLTSMGLVAFGMRFLKISPEVKWKMGIPLLGAQLFVSHYRPFSIASDIEQLNTEEGCQRIYAKLQVAELSLKDGAQLLLALYGKATDYKRLEDQIPKDYLQFADHLEGWAKTKAYIDLVEFQNAHECFSEWDETFQDKIPGEGLSAEELKNRRHWLQTRGAWIEMRWKIWRELAVFDEMTRFLESPDCTLNLMQKLDLCEEYWHVVEDGDPILRFEERLIEGLEGFEKCKAYTAYVEFLGKHVEDEEAFKPILQNIFTAIFPGLAAALRGAEKASFDAWMESTGSKTQNSL